MYTKSILAVTGLIAAVAAVPMKRDIEWVTQTEETVVTVPVTTTVWVDATGAPDHNVNPHYGHHHAHSTSTIQMTVTVPSAPAYTPPAPSAPESSPVAPVESSPAAPVTPEAPTSTSVYVPPTTSSVYTPPPAPTTSTEAAPVTTEAPSSTWEAPSSTWVPPTTTSAAPPAYSSPSSGGGSPSGSTYTGDITYYAVGMGSCGQTSTDDQAVVALAHGMMQASWTGNPNDNPLCGKEITISYGGVQKTATIVDTCPGCDGASLDLSNSLFMDFAPLATGRVSGVDWWYNS